MRIVFNYWWIAYDIIKNIMRIMIDSSQTSTWPIRPQNVCLYTKFEVIWTNENRVMGKRSWRIFYYVIWENGLVGVLLPTNMAAAIKMYGDFQNFEQP